jgi:hypothetical protein
MYFACKPVPIPNITLDDCDIICAGKRLTSGHGGHRYCREYDVLFGQSFLSVFVKNILTDINNFMLICSVYSKSRTISREAHTAISIKVVHEQSGKVEYERERLLGIANKLMNFQSDSQRHFALVFDFSALFVDNLN